ncbi:hypothetical protein ACFVVP_25760 [Streptomyces sp. NPDC058128]|uniref:hypothetical protein n=1 Tax=Streptomyces sp. NPDC058128 TaxID=3346352 RepID=UPI0036F0C722
MSTDIGTPEFPSASFWGVVNCWSKPWEGVPVTLKQSFNARDEITFHVVVAAGYEPGLPSVQSQGVVTVAADASEASYTIPWEGLLDTVTKGVIRVWCSVASASGGAESRSRQAEVSYNRETPDGVCSPSDPQPVPRSPEH